MYRFLRLFTVLFLALFILVGSSQAITKVARRYNIVDMQGGYAAPVGSYNETAGIPFLINGRSVDVDAGDVYNDTWYMGLSYGQLIARRFQVSVGFRFTEHSLQDTIPLPFDTILVLLEDLKLRQYDIDVNANYMALDLVSSGWSPYVGLGIHTGFTTASLKGYESESQLTFGMSLNFGAEVKLYSAPSGRSFVTLASMNNWNFLGTNDRPKYLHIGGGLKYYFRP